MRVGCCAVSGRYRAQDGSFGCGGDFRVRRGLPGIKSSTKVHENATTTPQCTQKAHVERQFWPAGRSGGQLYWHHQASVAPPHSHSHDGRGRRDDCSGGCAGQVVALGDGALLTNGPVTNGPVGRGPAKMA